MNKELQAEQTEIVKYANELKWNLPKLADGKRKWNKYLGSVTNILVIDKLNAHLPNDFRAIGPSVFIEGVPNEFDIIIVQKKTKPFIHTNSYPRSSTKAAIEVKKTGFFHNKREAEEKMRIQREKLLENLQGIPDLYITLHENETLMRATRRVYGENAFFLSTRSGKNLQVIPREWERFLQAVLSIIG